MPTAQVLIVVTAVMASLLEIIDTSIVNVAIPTMMGNLGATLEDISWVVTGYIISNAIVLPIAAWMGMRIGRKTYYTGCILLFTAASVACGMSPNLATLIIFRVIQGFAGGALLPTSQAIIQEVFPGPKSGMGSAIYGMSVMIGPTVGPTLGGYLTDTLGWRSIFNVNLPLGLICAMLSYLYIEDVELSPAMKEKAKAAIDFVGLTFLIVGIGTLQYVLERGEADDWFASRTILLCTIAAVISIPSFIYWELKTPHPIVDLRLFKHTAVRVGTIMMAEVGAMLYALIFFIPVFASITLGFTATQTGELFIPGALMSAAMMPLIGSQLRKRDPRMIIIFGLFGMETALFLLSGFSAQTSAEQMFWPLLIRGGAMAFLFVPINATVLSQFRGPELGQVAGLMNLSRQIGGSVGIAAFSSLFTKYRAQIRTDLSPRVSLLEPNAYSAYRQSLGFIRGKLSSSVGFIQAHDAALRTLAGRLEKQVFVLGYCKIMATAGLVFAVSFVPLYFMRKPQGPIAAVDAH